MRIAVDHRTHYRFSKPQARLVQMLRMTPLGTEGQTIVDWNISVSCDAKLRYQADGYGNAVTMLYADGPIEQIEIAVTGEVLTSETHGIARGAPEPLPPMLFRRLTPMTRADDAIAGFADALGDPLRDPLDWLHRLNRAIGDRFDVVASSSGSAPCEAPECFAQAALSPRGLAHVFLASARHAGIPARHIGGYSLVPCVDRAHPRPHDWVEAHVEGIGWIGFDPSIGQSPDLDHVRVAVGLDSSETAPIAGSRLGEGKEELDVELSVDQLGGAND